MEKSDKTPKIVTGIESDIQGKSIQPVIPMAAGFRQVAKFEEYPEGAKP